MENQLEIWKDIPEYEGYYKVSNLGRVKSFKLGKEYIMKNGDDGTGYLRVILCLNGKQKTRRIHQLVAEAFFNHKRCGYLLVVNHKDFNKHNNNVENLELVTARENANQKHIKSTSKHVGVHWDKVNNKWRASIGINGKVKNLGRFIDEIDASNCYQNALSEHLKIK